MSKSKSKSKARSAKVKAKAAAEKRIADAIATKVESVTMIPQGMLVRGDLIWRKKEWCVVATTTPFGNDGVELLVYGVKCGWVNVGGEAWAGRRARRGGVLEEPELYAALSLAFRHGNYAPGPIRIETPA